VNWTSCCKVVQLSTQISQGSVATDLRPGGRFKFLRSLFLNATVKELLQNWSTFAKVVVKIETARVYGPPCGCGRLSHDLTRQSFTLWQSFHLEKKFITAPLIRSINAARRSSLRSRRQNVIYNVRGGFWRLSRPAKCPKLIFFTFYLLPYYYLARRMWFKDAICCKRAEENVLQ